MYIIHQQKQKSFLPVISIYILLGFLLLYVIFFRDLVLITQIILGGVLLVDILFFKFFSELTFQITSEGLQFGFGIFKRKIHKQNIKSVFIEDGEGKFKGYGIVRGQNKINGFIAQTSSGLSLSTKDNVNFFVSLDDPQTALDILKENKYV